MQPKALYTIGYEGGSVDAFLRALRQAGVELVLDVRAVAASRKRGFSKTQLATHLAEAGIGYCHLRGLGTPKAGRDAAHIGDRKTFLQVFLAHMEEPEARFDLAEAVALAKERRVCLLCLERDPKHCHRLIVAKRVAAETGQDLDHLFVEPPAR